MTAADRLSASRIALAAILWLPALMGQGRLVGIGLVVAALTDVLDGRLARHRGTVSRRGARLDALADLSLMVSAGFWVAILHPTLLSDSSGWVAVAAVMYLVSTIASWLALGRLVDPSQVTGKLAGGLLYGFALLTLLSGAAEPALLRVALLALVVSSADTFARAMRTIHVSGIARSARSQAPQAVNAVASKTAPSTSIAASAAPATTQTLP
jgi:CDP-diacylglycerol--glycerol-3-phosphate 3-phosphatidyltransferase/cardiolipin synthase